MITIELVGIKEAMKDLDPGKVRLAAMRSINKAAKETKVEAGRAICDKFNIQPARVKTALKSFRMATSTDLTAVIQAESRPIGLMNFGARWVRNVRGKARSTTATKSNVGKRRSKNTGVTVKILKGKGTTLRLPNAFIGRGRSGLADGGGALRVFQRSDKSRSNSPVISKASVTIASMFEQKNVEERMIKKIDTVFTKEFSRQLGRLFK